MRVFILTCLALMTTLQAWACTVCQSNQPKVLENITHGTGPESNWDYAIIWSAVAIVLVTLFLSIKYLVIPKESNEEHIKYIVIENI